MSASLLPSFRLRGAALESEDFVGENKSDTGPGAKTEVRSQSKPQDVNGLLSRREF